MKKGDATGHSKSSISVFPTRWSRHELLIHHDKFSIYISRFKYISVYNHFITICIIWSKIYLKRPVAVRGWILDNNEEGYFILGENPMNRHALSDDCLMLCSCMQLRILICKFMWLLFNKYAETSLEYFVFLLHNFKNYDAHFFMHSIGHISL